MSNPSALKISGILVAASLCLFPMHGHAAFVQAGFQWVVPQDAPAAQMAPVTSAPLSGGYVSSPSAPIVNGPEIISPVIIEAPRPVIVHAAPVTISTPSSSEVLSSAPAVAPRRVDSPASLAPMPAVSSSVDVVQGFAKQVPLAVALRQLLPPGYGFSVDQNVDLGTLVSFQGGQSWRETLRTALEPAGLVMREQGQMVTIAHGEQQAYVPSEAPKQPVSVAAVAPHTLQSPSLASEPVTMPSSEIGSGSVVQAWSAERGDTLHKIMEEWSRRANVEFDWKSEYDYPLMASVSFSGTFEDAVRNLLTGFEGAHPQPVAELHANSNLGQMVLVVSTRGNNYSN